MTAPLFGAPDPAPLVPPVTYLPDWLDTHAATFAWCERHLPWEHRGELDGRGLGYVPALPGTATSP